MPATVVLFENVPKAPPRRLFVDTSFIKEILEFSRNSEDARAKSTFAFYEKVWKNNGRMWTTPFTVEEILWGFVRRALLDTAGTFELKSIRDLKQSRRADYVRTIESCQPTVRSMIAALNRLKISFEFPGDQAAMRGNWAHMVWQRAGEILDRFAIETADAFHIACATVAGTVEIVSLDDDFKAVDGVTVYCYS